MSDAPLLATSRENYTRYNDVGIVISRPVEVKRAGNIPAVQFSYPVRPIVKISVPAMTLIEQAVQYFLDRVGRISGVAQVKLYGEQTGEYRSVAVAVPELQTPTSRAVFELEAETLRSFRNAGLDVRVIGLKERGIDIDGASPSEIADVMPD